MTRLRIDCPSYNVWAIIFIYCRINFTSKLLEFKVNLVLIRETTTLNSNAPFLGKEIVLYL